jgi:hypothetical protein
LPPQVSWEVPPTYGDCKIARLPTSLGLWRRHSFAAEAR